MKRVPSAGASRKPATAVRHPLAAGRVQHGAQEMPRVGLELGFGDADRLEVEHVEELALEDHSKISSAGPAHWSTGRSC